jgi:hypothetical protein
VRALLALAIVSASLLVAAAPAAPATSRCSTTFTLRGHTYLAISQTLSCSQALPIARGLVTAPTIGHVTVGGTTVLKLRPPAGGWVCATASTTRARGAACKRDADLVTEVRVG